MNTAPILHGRALPAIGHTVNAPGCGHMALDNAARAFWQSRHPRHERIALTDLRQLAREIRRHT